MKAGTFKTEIQKEEILWYDKKRTFFGLPWSFTKYTITESRLKISTGFWKRQEENIQLYRISDMTLTKTFGERLCKVGTVSIASSDSSCPEAKLMHVKKPDMVRDLLLQAVEHCREKYGVSTSEIVGGPKPKKPDVPPEPPVVHCDCHD